MEKFSTESSLLGEKLIKKRLSRKYGDLGAVYLGNNKSSLARAALLKSLGHDPFSLRHMLFLLLTGIPFSIRSSLKSRVRVIRKKKNEAY